MGTTKIGINYTYLDLNLLRNAKIVSLSQKLQRSSIQHKNLMCFNIVKIRQPRIN